MLLEALFSSAAEAVFSYILDSLEPAERLRDWLKRNPVRLAYQHALARTYAAFARQYPELTASLFNASFLTIEAAPELAKFLTRHQHPDHTQLVRLWAKSITPQTEASQPSVEMLSKREDFNAASAYFVKLLTSELKCESALQPLFDSRALESLPAIEAKLDALRASMKNSLKQALTIANTYQQTVVNAYQQTITNRSGGVDLQAQEVAIGGDVVGRDKIVSNAYNTYFSGDFSTLDDLYVRPDAVFQRVRVQDFVGREWLTAKVDHFLNDEKHKSGVFLLVGEAGVGKTSFMAHLVTERRYLHVFAEQVPSDANVSRALQSLGAQLVTRYQIDPYKDNRTLPAIATFPDFLDKLLRLAADKLSAGEKIVIVCDALDEAGTAPNGNVFGLPSVLPDGVYFILSQRPVPVKLSVKADLIKETIDAAGADNLHDIEHYLTAVSHRPQVSNQLRAHNYSEADFVRILKDRSGGVWMYLFYVISEIAAGSRAPLDLATLPSGLAGYYTDYWGDWCEGRKGRGEGPHKWEGVYARLLATLAAAQVPISLHHLMAWSNVQATENEVERLLRRNWRAFIVEREINDIPHFALYHASLRDFLTGQVDQQEATFEAEQLTNELSHRTHDAHCRIVEYYRQQCSGKWVKLVDDNYARDYLSLHLSMSGEDETLHQLVAMDNAWAEVNYANDGTYASYLIDLHRAWQSAETNRHWNIGRQIRYALIESSIHSLAHNISADLLRLLVQTRIWSSARALAHIPQIPSQYIRGHSLSLLASLLPDSLMAEAVSVARTLTDEYDLARALSGLAPHLPEPPMAEALSVARAITNEDARALALTGLAPHLSEPLMAKALGAARAITNEDARAQALTGFAQHLPEPLMIEALSAARAITDEIARASALTGLAPHLPEPLKAQTAHEALTAARAIADEIARARTLTSLTPHLPEPLQAQTVRETLSAARTITNETARARVLTSLAPHLLPESLRAQTVQEALSAARAISNEYARAEALTDLAPHLLEPLMAEALGAARAIINEYARALALAGLAPHLPKPLMTEALSAARTITNGGEYDTFINENALALALTGLAPYLPEPLMTEALSAACAITNDTIRAEALTGLAPYLPGPLMAEALSTARAIAYEYARALALAGLASHLPEPLQAQTVQEALSVARVITHTHEFARALAGLAPHLPKPLMTEALSAARAITDEYARALALADLAPHLSEQLITEALSAARAIADEAARARALTGLASHLPEPLKAQTVQDALNAARAITHEYAHARALTDLVPYLPEQLKAQTVQDALSVAQAITYFRAEVLTDLAPYLPEPLMTKALSAARAITDETARIRALAGLASYLPEPLKTQIVQEALSAARTITNETARARVLTSLAPHLPEPLMTEALSAARAITDETARAEALIDLAPHLPELLMAEALSTARAIAYEYARAHALAGLAPRLPDLLIAEALSAARAITNDNPRAEALTSLSSHLANELRIEVFSVSFSVAELSVIRQIMAMWSKNNFVEFQVGLWTEKLHTSARNIRFVLLDDLIALLPLIEHLGGKSAIEDFFYALHDIMTWWP